MPKKKDPSFFKIDMFMKVNGTIMKEVDEECKFGKMDLFIKVIGRITQLMAMEDLSIPMEMYTLENGKMIRPMEKVYFILYLGKYISSYGAQYVG